MASTAASLYDACAELLAAAAASLTDPPARQYVSPGPVALDCEQLTVHAAPISLADTDPSGPGVLQGARRASGVSVNLVGLVVTVVRCVPTIEEPSKGRLVIPSVTTLDASARIVLADGWQLWNGIKQRHRANTLLPGSCRDVFIDPAIPITPSGGLGGWFLTVRTNLDGITA